ISFWVAQAISNCQWVLILTHRIQLGEALCQRFGVPYVTELRNSETGAVFGYGVCVDSLHPGSQAHFNAENWEDGLVILDEAEQVLWHMLNSSTCQKERVPILNSFKTLIQNALATDGRVILSDADLSDVSIDYIKQLAGVKDSSPFIIQNDWKPSGWNVYQYDGRSPEGLIAGLLEHIEQGGKPFVCVAGQKRKSKWSTTNLERYLQDHFPELKILRIDSESVSDPTHPAYCCILHLNEVIVRYDLILASSSIETGVSIDIRGHFTSVWGISYGLCSVPSFLQKLSRPREEVDRHIWVAKYGLGKIGNGASSIKSLLASQHKLTRANIRLLNLAGYEALDEEEDFQPESLLTWAKMASRINATMPCYRDAVVEALRSEGHTVLDVTDDPEQAKTREVIKEGIIQTRNANCLAEREAIAQVELIDEPQYKALKDQRAKTLEERQQERKYELSMRYGIEVSSDLVAMDEVGWYPKILLHYLLSLGREYLSDRDKRMASAQVEAGNGDIWKPDFNRSQMGLKVEALDRLGITSLLSQVMWSEKDAVTRGRGDAGNNAQQDNVQRDAFSPELSDGNVQGSKSPTESNDAAALFPKGSQSHQQTSPRHRVSPSPRLFRESGQELRDSDPEVQEIATLALSNPWQIKAILGLTVGENESPVRIVGRLLQLVGVRLKCIGRVGSRDNRQRVYRLIIPDEVERSHIFAVWLERDKARREETQSVSMSLKDQDNTKTWVPDVGSIVRWLKEGTEKLLVLAANSAGEVMVRSLLSGLVTHASVEQVKAV
ncbi:MAG: plasmid replication protein, CyRepA1 family, partial [Coleofasciculaceae cyanobacterium]